MYIISGKDISGEIEVEIYGAVSECRIDNYELQIIGLEDRVDIFSVYTKPDIFPRFTLRIKYISGNNIEYEVKDIDNKGIDWGKETKGCDLNIW